MFPVYFVPFFVFIVVKISIKCLGMTIVKNNLSSNYFFHHNEHKEGHNEHEAENRIAIRDLIINY